MNILYLDGEYQDVIRFKPSDTRNFIDLLQCPNPHCGCGDCQLIFFKEEEYEDHITNGIPVAINVFEKTVFPVEYELSAEQKKKSAELELLLKEKLTDEDWALLKIRHRTQKEKSIEKDNRDSGFEYQFTKEHLLDESLMISYESIFPLCELFKVNGEAGEYTIVEQYCKNVQCDCTEVNFHIFEGGKYIQDFSYDYENETVEDPKNEWIVAQLRENYVGFKQRIEFRDLIIKNLYAKECLKIQKEYYESLKKATYYAENKPGRNDKCPCGSGKKYKKCCINKGVF